MQEGEEGRGMECKKEMKGGGWSVRRRGREEDGGKEGEEGRAMDGKKERKGRGWMCGCFAGWRENRHE